MAERSTRAWQLLEEALRLSGPEREAHLRRACEQEPSLRAEIEGIFADMHAVGDRFAAEVLPPDAHEAVTAAPPPAPPPPAATQTPPGEGAIESGPGAAIGPYTLLSVLGEGGFGVVFLAERRQPMVQRVAVKIIKPGMDSARVIARFEQERQVLAMMDHPNIARVLDAGATPAGRPYFVMEYVKGEPITRYCDRQRLSIRQRLELFIPVCEAVQHAHNRGVIHRDLKPSNVLVSVVDNHVVPKVIDFGVAKAITHIATAGEIFTQQGVFVGTPEYMSPEQAEMGPTDIDTRTDVFSLGVMLYELLTGSLPLEGATLRRAGLAEIQRLIRETERPRPSTRLSELAESQAETAQRVADSRQAHIDELSRELRRELDWIPLKALRTNRTERYRSPAELADDIRNYLEGRALTARPPSAAYIARKFVHRHRASVATAAMVFGAVVLGGGVAAWKWRAEAIARGHEAAARVEAQDQRDAADSLLGFVNTTVLGGTGEGKPTLPVPVTDLDRARDEFLGRFADRPEMLRRLGITFGRAYLVTGQPERVRDLAERLKAAGAGADDPEVAALLGEALFRERRPEAVEVMTRAVAAKVASLGPAGATDPTLADMRSRLAGAMKWSGDYDGARLEYQRERAIRAAANPPDARQLRWVDYNLALTDIAQARALAAARSIDDTELHRHLQTAQDALGALRDQARADVGDQDEQTLACAVEAADLDSVLGRADAAVAALTTLSQTMDEVLGPRHWRALETRGRLAKIELSARRFDHAAALLEPALRGYRATQGEGATDSITIARWLAMAYERMDRREDAVALLSETIDRAEPAGAVGTALARIADQLEKLCDALGRAQEAEQWRRRAAAWRAGAPVP